MAILCALDTSTTSSGYAVFIDGEWSYSACIKKDNKDSAERVKDMIRAIYDVLKNADIVVIELPSLVRNPKTNRELLSIYGAVLGKCVEEDIFFYDFRPSEWRKLVKGDDVLPRKRKELKEWAVKKIKIEYGKDVTDDEAEAILIGEAYIKAFG